MLSRSEDDLSLRAVSILCHRAAYCLLFIGLSPHGSMLPGVRGLPFRKELIAALDSGSRAPPSGHHALSAAAGYGVSSVASDIARNVRLEYGPG